MPTPLSEHTLRPLALIGGLAAQQGGAHPHAAQTLSAQHREVKHDDILLLAALQLAASVTDAVDTGERPIGILLREEI